MKRFCIFITVLLLPFLAFCEGDKGNRIEDSTVSIFFRTGQTSGAVVAPSSALATSDFAIYKGTSDAQKTSANGLTITNVDAVTGRWRLDIDTSNDTGDIGFWTVDSEYNVVIASAKTLDSIAIESPIGSFGIESRFDEVNVTAMAPDVITATVIAADAIGAAEIAAGAITVSEAPTLDQQISAVIDIVESHRGEHTASGVVFYVDPVNGTTFGGGGTGTKLNPLLGIQDAHDNLITDANHDVIILVAGAASGRTTLTEDVVLTKEYFFIRGPGRDFIWTRSGNGDTISITGDGIELAGFQLETAATGSGDGVQITDADFARVCNVWINETQGDGINILRGSNSQICCNTFQGTGQGGSGEGIHILGTGPGVASENIIERNIFSDVAGDAIRVEDGTIEHTHIMWNMIHTSDAWGINIGASSVNALVHNNVLKNNASGAILDNGTGTGISNNVDWAKHSIATETRLAELDAANLPADVDALPLIAEFATVNTGETTGVDGSVIQLAASDTWEEVRNEHTVGGTMGQAIKQFAEIIISSGTAQSAANDFSIVLDSSEPVTAGLYDPSRIVIVGGTGMKQSRLIYEYSIDGASRLAIVDRDWKTRPDNTSEYLILADAGRETVNEGLAMGGGASSITLNSLASSDNNAYLHQIVMLRAGVGTDQTAICIAYNGTTKVLTTDRPWVVQPTAATVYNIQPSGPSTLRAGAITASVFDGSTAFPVRTTDIDANVVLVLEDTSTTLPALILSSSPPTVEEIAAEVDSVLSASHGPGAWGGAGGDGSATLNYTLRLTDGVTPVDDCLVEVFTEIGMSNITASRRTDAFGLAVFSLDPGTYYLKRTKGGITFTNPLEAVVN